MKPHSLEGLTPIQISSTIRPTLEDYTRSHQIAVYVTVDLSSPSVGQLFFLKVGEGCTHQEAPDKVHWGALYAGMLDLEKMTIEGDKTYPFTFRDDVEVLLVKEGRRIAIDPLEEIVVYRREGNKKYVASRVKGIEAAQEFIRNSAHKNLFMCIVSRTGRNQKHLEIDYP